MLLDLSELCRANRTSYSSDQTCRSEIQRHSKNLRNFARTYAALATSCIDWCIAVSGL